MSTPYYVDDRVTVYQGDALAVLPLLPDQSVDAVVTDPPYGLEFMGREWDSFGRDGAGPRAKFSKSGLAGPRLVQPSFLGGGQASCANCGGDKYRATESGKRRRCDCDRPQFPNVGAIRGAAYQEWCQAWAAECLRLLRPGGHLLAFGGSRTFHRLVCAVEDAGFEIRDTISWLYGSGFPKSLDVSKAIDKAAGAARTWQGWGTALKPGWEPIVVARKPLAGTVAANVQAHGTGGLNIDACRVAHASGVDLAESKAKNPGRGDLVTSGTYGANRPQQSVNDAGRWPPNVTLTHAADCGAECVPGCPVAELDQQSGDVKAGGSKDNRGRLHWAGVADTRTSTRDDIYHSYDDTGGASRFFPTFRYEAKATPAERPRHGGTVHPTVKPLELMRWLVRLITPPAGLVLDPFVGSGTTAEACTVEGFRCIAVEREPTYLPLIRVRLAKPIQDVLPLGVTP
jgi:site-specific DNA-methyltransferase (adenine-specific)